MHIEDSVESERKRVIQNQQIGAVCKGLRVVGINKIYRSSLFGFPSEKDVHAVNNVYFEVEDGELMSILGHNGAGIQKLCRTIINLPR